LLVDVIKNVFAGDATAGAGADDVARVDAVIGDEAAHDG
jgi:hypothetical protein